MIISLAHRFVLVRGMKVAGTSIEMALSTICGPDDIVPPMVPVEERKRQEMHGRCGNYSDQPAVEKAYVKLVMAMPPEQLYRLHPPPSRYSIHMSLAEIAAEFPRSLDGFRIVG